MSRRSARRKGAGLREALLLLLLLAACEWLTEPRERLECPPGGEFASLGCARIEGMTLGPSGEPLAGAYVWPAFTAAHEGCCDTPLVRSDGEGRFALVVSRYVRIPGPVADPDTMTIVVHAGSAAAGAAAPTLVKLSAVGTVPTPVTVEIRLTDPPPGSGLFDARPRRGW